MLRHQILLLLVVSLLFPACVEDCDDDAKCANAHSQGAYLFVDQTQLVFPETEVGSRVSQTLTLQSAGQVTLSNIEIVGRHNKHFELVHDLDESVVLTDGEQVEIQVDFVPTEPLSTVTATLRITSDTEASPLDIFLSASTSAPLAPCLEVSPTDALDLGGVSFGATASETVRISNCGNAPLTLSQVALSEDSDRVWGLQTGISSPEVLEPGGVRSFVVTLEPVRGMCGSQGCSATLLIVSDDPERPEVMLPLTGQGRDNTCPTAVAEVRRFADPNASSTQDTLIVEPLDVVELLATHSSDPEGDALTFSWSVVEAPEDFAIALEPSNTVTKPRLQVALIGDYVIELNVTDALGEPACEPARLHVQARTSRDLVIELTWRAERDDDPTDTGQGAGTDLDLHMIEPGGIWNDGQRGTATDCFFLNLKPEWGDSGTLEDNPNLDRDDIDTGGPEQLNIGSPHPTDGTGPAGYDQPYLVGAYYYDAYTFGASYARIKIYTHQSPIPAVIWPSTGAQERELVASSDQGAGDFWLAGEIHWSADGTPTINERDELYTGFPDWGCVPDCTEGACHCN